MVNLMFDRLEVMREMCQMIYGFVTTESMVICRDWGLGEP